MKAPKIIFILAMAAAVFACPFNAQAYVLPAEQIFTFMTRALGPLRSLTIQETVIIHPDSPENQAPETVNEAAGAMLKDVEKADPSENAPQSVQLSGKISYRFSSRFREDINGLEGDNILIVSPRGAAKVIGNRLVAESEDQYDLFKEPLMARNPKILMNRLSLSGVNTEITSLGRWRGGIAYIIGAQYPDETSPQIWIDKKTFLPVRYITTRSVPGIAHEGLEVIYEDWRGLAANKDNKPKARYPGRIVFVQNKKILSERIMESYAVNPSLDENLFSISAVKASYEPSPVLMEEQSMSSEMDEVREVIDGFRRVVE